LPASHGLAREQPGSERNADPRCVLVFRAPALDDLQRRPARAVEEVVEEAERERFQVWGFRFQVKAAV